MFKIIILLQFLGQHCQVHIKIPILSVEKWMQMVEYLAPPFFFPTSRK